MRDSQLNTANPDSYPITAFRFSVFIGQSSISDGPDASFHDISGISASLGTEELLVGGDNENCYRLPTQVKYSPLILKRGVMKVTSELAKWTEDVLSSGLALPIKTKNIAVKLLDDQGNPLVTWVFEGAFPTKYEISSLNAMSNELLIETFELTYRRFYRA
jgi:phage tail-like protein